MARPCGGGDGEGGFSTGAPRDGSCGAELPERPGIGLAAALEKRARLSEGADAEGAFDAGFAGGFQPELSDLRAGLVWTPCGRSGDGGVGGKWLPRDEK